jgi:hypothetical protein
LEARHALAHLADLRRRVNYLRPMRPGNPTFLIWIGDVAELVNSYWGSGSPESERLAKTLRGAGADGSNELGIQFYLERLRAIDGVLGELERELSPSGPG